jgi:hypothetical protein
MKSLFLVVMLKLVDKFMGSAGSEKSIPKPYTAYMHLTVLYDNLQGSILIYQSHICV